MSVLLDKPIGRTTANNQFGMKESALLTKVEQLKRPECERPNSPMGRGYKRALMRESCMYLALETMHLTEAEGQTGTIMLFWDVDTQVDFLSPQGRLYVPGAESILPNLARLTRCAGEKHFPLISSACAHLPGDPELATFGQHCMVGTQGQQKVLQSLLPLRYIVPNHPIELPDLKTFQQVIIEKQAFDPFTNPNADAVLRQVGSAQIVLYGVVTDICVAATADSLLARGRRVSMVMDAICALDTEKAAHFVEDFQSRGGRITNTDQVTKTP